MMSQERETIAAADEWRHDGEELQTLVLRGGGLDRIESEFW